MEETAGSYRLKKVTDQEKQYFQFWFDQQPAMEVALEMEDDLFFADLTKQISLLIMDDDDDPFLHSPPALSLQAYSGRINPPARPPLIQEQRAWLTQSKGTGVFIPRSLQPRRKNINGKFNPQNNKLNRQPDRAKVWSNSQVSPIFSRQPKN